MSDSLKVGDVVKLISGGQPMTIVRLIGSDEVECMWFAPLNTERTLFESFPQEAKFPLGAVRRADP